MCSSVPPPRHSRHRPMAVSGGVGGIGRSAPSFALTRPRCRATSLGSIPSRKAIGRSCQPSRARRSTWRSRDVSSGGRGRVSSGMVGGSRWLAPSSIPRRGAARRARGSVDRPIAASDDRRTEPRVVRTPITQPRVRVLVAEDHPLFRDGIVRAIRERPNLEVVGEAADGRQALELAAGLQPDVIVLDVKLPELDGLQVLNALRRDASASRVLALSAFTDGALVHSAIAAGAAGLLKSVERSEVCDAIEAVARGDTVLAPSLQAGLVAEVRAQGAAPERPRLDRARARGPRAHRRRPQRAGDRRAPAPRAGHGQDPPRPPVRQTRSLRPRGGRRRGDAPRAPG